MPGVLAVVLLVLCMMLQAFAEASVPAAVPEWRLALPGWKYEFPRDHFAHPEFKTEWWYFTGNLRAKNAVTPGGNSPEFGYQLTFFRQGIRRELPEGTMSRFAVRDLLFAHFAVADIHARKHHYFHNWSRGAFGEAGLGQEGERVVFIGNRVLRSTGNGTFFLEAEEGDIALRLKLQTQKPPVFHGEDGVSQKAEGEGRASHYYSFTRLETTGIVRLGGLTFEVEGLSWYDHEWATNQLTENQTGWDWFSIQLEDGRDLMLFQIRTREGGRDPFSSGTWVERDGSTIQVHNDGFTLIATRWWTSPKTGGTYPVSWRLEIPALRLDLGIKARFDTQEFAHPPIAYWEGAIRVEGKVGEVPVRGTGYLEMTGYAGPIVGIQAPAGL
jgi:predicted secreted hydrolase